MKMKIKAAILLGVFFIVQLIPSESAPMNGKLINMYIKFLSK